MSSFKEIKATLRKYRIFPSKKLGQNFLIDKNILKEIIEAAELSEKDIVLEIGPGIGNLTIELAKKVKEVIAIEKDIKMVQVLEEILEEKNIKNVKIVNADILKFLDTKHQIQNTKYKVVANIPYYLTSRLIRKLLELKNKPRLIVLMVQKEIAQRICGKPPKMNLLAVSVQFYGKPEIVSFVSKKSFWPSPKVDSAIIKIIPKRSKPFGNVNLFFKIVKVGFSQPRKQLVNNFSRKLGIDKMKVKEWLLKKKIEPTKRAENLSIKEWLKLTKNGKEIFI